MTHRTALRALPLLLLLTACRAPTERTGAAPSGLGGSGSGGADVIANHDCGMSCPAVIGSLAPCNGFPVEVCQDVTDDMLIDEPFTLTSEAPAAGWSLDAGTGDCLGPYTTALHWAIDLDDCGPDALWSTCTPVANFRSDAAVEPDGTATNKVCTGVGYQMTWAAGVVPPVRLAAGHAWVVVGSKTGALQAGGFQLHGDPWGL